MKPQLFLSLLIAGMVLTGIYACSTIPEGAVAVKPFDKTKYLGKWYEIARLDYRHEKNMDNVTAEYSLNDNGTIKVDNNGFNTKTGKWEQAIGKAKFAVDEQTAMLRVSFFGPFYSGYNVIAIDDEYRYALVAGENLEYMWILSRDTRIPDNIKLDYVRKAEMLGYKTAELVWVKHDERHVSR
jgi:apolipoprotein D and lipocalin family protein